MFVGVMLGIVAGVCCSVPIVLVARYHCRLLDEKSDEDNGGGRNILEAMDGDDASQDDDTGTTGKDSDVVRSIRFAPGTKKLDGASESRPPRFRNTAKGGKKYIIEGGEAGKK